jgi:hypothetical protein
MSTHPFAGAVDLGQHMAAKQRRDGLADADDFTKTLDILDSEAIVIGDIWEALQEKARGRSLNYADFDREIKERYAEAGFVVDVVWYHTNVESVKMPEIVFKARTERKEFDRDQMVHEVTNDILGTGQGGVIKTDKAMMKALEEGSYGGGPKHKH